MPFFLFWGKKVVLSGISLTALPLPFLFPLQHVLQTKMDNVQEVLCHILHLDFDRSGATTNLYIFG
jgi:hypothetical protein